VCGSSVVAGLLVGLGSLCPDFADSSVWNPLLTRLAQRVRQQAPEHTLIADANSGSLRVDWNSITALSDLATIPGEHNVVYGFIFFDPVIFTHQGASWRDEWPELQYTHDVPFPASPDGVAPILPTIADSGARAEVESYGRDQWNTDLLALNLDRVSRWSADHCARVMCVEFGAYRKVAPPDSVVRWIEDTRTLLEQRHMAWSYWSYSSEQFTLVPEQPGPVLAPDLAEALGLSQ
jgi:endoglucanase